jgi:hypothetical protein
MIKTLEEFPEGQPDNPLDDEVVQKVAIHWITTAIAQPNKNASFRVARQRRRIQ